MYSCCFICCILRFCTTGLWFNWACVDSGKVISEMLTMLLLTYRAVTGQRSSWHRLALLSSFFHVYIFFHFVVLLSSLIISNIFSFCCIAVIFYHFYIFFSFCCLAVLFYNFYIFFGFCCLAIICDHFYIFVIHKNVRHSRVINDTSSPIADKVIEVWSVMPSQILGLYEVASWLLCHLSVRAIPRSLRLSWPRAVHIATSLWGLNLGRCLDRLEH